ncbi:CYCT1 protein [Gonium pectorale]|uniref:CYCT1 protein n=1 Tax=Gonium pectorale TaxID=33097 RepID=A0A150FV21_GONPE|nr:CYCT1 protein [Gonium pectorale]|eukprot:KXZ41462.1 CYCT1 protein [Gonium pectorale]
MERVKEEVLQAERAVLYTLGFDLNITHPYQNLIDWLNKEKLLTDLPHESPFKPLVQNAWNLVNDSLRTTLCLQFPPPKLAGAALWMADLMNVEDGTHYSRLTRMGEFYEAFQLHPQELSSICDQMLSEYEHSKLSRLAAGAGQPLPAVKADVEARLGPSRMAAAGAAAAPGGPGPAGVAVKAEEEEGEVKD